MPADPRELVEDCRAVGITLSIEGDHVLARPGRLVSAALAREIGRHKVALIELLGGTAPPAPPPEPEPVLSGFERALRTLDDFGARQGARLARPDAEPCRCASCAALDGESWRGY